MSYRESYLSYRGFLWLWVCLFILIFLTIGYIFYTPVGGHSGGTVLGYAYGIIATMGILYLMYYGIRKRSFNAKYSTLKGTLAAHVWIGIALVFIVPLHSGFSFGLNIHTLAYVLMLAVIFSGVWGVVMYGEQPTNLRSQRGEGTIKQLLAQVREISNEAQELLGIAVAVQKSEQFLKMVKTLDFVFEPTLWKALTGKNPKSIEAKQIATVLSVLPDGEREEGLKLIQLANKRYELVTKIQNEAKAQTWIRLWLYLHLPLSFALLVAVCIHIFSVFFYW
jgi:hypothetical protein